MGEGIAHTPYNNTSVGGVVNGDKKKEKENVRGGRENVPRFDRSSSCAGFEGLGQKNKNIRTAKCE